jgi:hypothetical protein
MTTPVSARDHANMTVAEREFTFDALLADFEKLEDSADEADTSTAATAIESRVEPPVAESRARESRAREPQVDDPQALTHQAPDAAAPHSAQGGAASAAPRAVRRPASLRLPTLALPSPQVLKLSGLIAVAVLSLTLVFIALSR